MKPTAQNEDRQTLPNLETSKAAEVQDAGSAAAFLRRFPYEYPALLLALALVMLTMLEFIQNQKWLVLTCCLLSVLIVGFSVFRKRPRETRLFFLLYGLYLLWLALNVLWVCSGRFFLREFSKQLFCLPLVLFIFLFVPKKETYIRKLLFLLSAMGAFYAFFSVDIASVGLTRGLLDLIPGFIASDAGFERGTRLTGIFANANISAGLLALCIFLSLYLLESSENRRQRIFAAAFASLQAVTFLLNFSLGATGFFLVSVVVYLIFAGENRSSVFLRMLEIALPVLIAVFLSFRYFEVSDSRRAIPLVAMLLCAVITVILELAVFPQLSKALKGRNKLTSGILAAVFLLIIAYGAAGMLVHQGIELPKKQSLRRACYPTAGDYSLSLSVDGRLRVRIVSQNEREVIMHTETLLYAGAAARASFTVPDDARVVYLTFTSASGATLREITLQGPESITLPLGYPLLPDFIVNRLQGLLANENAIQRVAFFRDGMKIFRDHPILGAGLGCFETLLFGYQDFYYETKYVHNHYIQVLLDSGIVGAILYFSLLILTAAALWRGRKNGFSRSLHPALCAAFVMMVLHSVMEVVMSTTVYIPFAYAIMSVIAVCYASPVKKNAVDKLSAAIPGVVALAYAILITLNLNADAMVKKSTNNVFRFFNSLESAIKTDAFNKNDWKISYIETCSSTGSASYRAQADRYAQQLMDVPSNSLHTYLLSYYLSFRDYDQALLAAKRCVSFNSSDSKSWNNCFHSLSSALLDYPEDRAEILRSARELNEELEKYQARLMETIELDADSVDIIAASQNE